MKRGRNLWLAVVALIGFGAVTDAPGEDGMFTIYLVRHAEKEPVATDFPDPPLSHCGEMRAEALANMLKDAKLQRVYSTPYKRTLETAMPAAELHRAKVETYDPQHLEVIAVLLLERKQDSLVIGHSNTTAVLSGLLAGQEGRAFGEDEYDRLYQVTRSGDRAKLTLLHQAFSCSAQ